MLTSETFELVYDGPGLTHHQMDVRDLVHALRGLGDIIRSANAVVNGEKTSIQVLINAEHRRGSFAISIEVLQNVMDAAKSLLADDSVKTIKDILEWLQLIGVLGGTGVIGYLKWKAGRETESIQAGTDFTGTGVVQVTVKGDNNNVIVVPSEVYRLGTDPTIARATKEMVKPLKSPGIDKVYARTGKIEGMRIEKSDVSSIERSCDAALEENVVLSRNVVVAHLRPYDAEFNPQAKTWGFWYGGNHITADITKTEIAREAVERRKVSMDDIYKVDLEIAERRMPSGVHKNDCTILNLYERTSGPTQTDLFDDDEGHG